MKIDIDLEIGDPVILLSEGLTGYYFFYRGFRYSDIPNIGKTVFKTRKEAQAEKEKKEKR